MLCGRVNYRITCFVLNILFSFLCVESFAQDRENIIAKLKENYRIVRTENNVRIVRYDGYDDEMPYMLELAKAVPSSADVDKENSKLLKHSLQKYKVDNSVLLDAVRKHFSDKVDLAFVSFIVSKAGRFEYLYIFLLDRDNQKENKNQTSEYADDKYYDFLQWMIDNVELTPWNGPIPYCRGTLLIQEK